jgi:hypothetical protein
MKTTKTILSLLITFIILISAQSACKIVNKPTPTQVETPSVESETTPEGLVSLSKLVNIEGFACAAAMAINIQMSTIPDSPKTNVLCTDLIPSFQATANTHTSLLVPEWFISETNTFIHKKTLPLELQLHPSASEKDVMADLRQGILPIALVNAGGRFHAVVIVGYDVNKGGLAYLDSLRPKSKPLPYETDFFEDYGIKFQEAWIDTFELKITK